VKIIFIAVEREKLAKYAGHKSLQDPRQSTRSFRDPVELALTLLITTAPQFPQTIDNPELSNS
jgi:hypothetical protein